MSETGAGRPVWPGDSGSGDRTGDATREAVLARAFVRLADTLASDFDIVDFLHGLAEDSVEILRAAAATGSAGRPGRVPRVAGRAMQDGLTRRRHPEFRGVGLAHDDQSRAPQAQDELGVEV